MKSPEQIAEEIIRKFVMYDYTGNITGVGKGHLKFLINEAIEAERKESQRLREELKYYAKCKCCGGSGKTWEHDESCGNNLDGECTFSHPVDRMKCTHCAEDL